MKKMKIFITLLFSIVLFSGCKSDRIDHEDANYLYVWKYSLTDSTLNRYRKPRYVEYKVYGGRHKDIGKTKHRRHLIYVDFDRSGKYDYSFNVRNYDNKCYIVNTAMNTNYPLTGVFYEEYYPRAYRTFVRYK